MPGTWRDNGHFKAYATTSRDALAQQYYKCMPFEACVGSCPEAELKQAEDTGQRYDYSMCPGASGLASCTIAYTGDRCSQCTPFDPNREGPCVDSTPNGYYRLDQICEPCECTWLTPTVIVSIAFFALLVIMVAADHAFKEIDHLSTLFAPIMIAITFFQTLVRRTGACVHIVCSCLYATTGCLNAKVVAL